MDRRDIIKSLFTLPAACLLLPGIAEAKTTSWTELGRRTLAPDAEDVVFSLRGVSAGVRNIRLSTVGNSVWLYGIDERSPFSRAAASHDLNVSLPQGRLSVPIALKAVGPVLTVRVAHLPLSGRTDMVLWGDNRAIS